MSSCLGSQPETSIALLIASSVGVGVGGVPSVFLSVRALRRRRAQPYEKPITVPGVPVAQPATGSGFLGVDAGWTGDGMGQKIATRRPFRCVPSNPGVVRYTSRVRSTASHFLRLPPGMQPLFGTKTGLRGPTTPADDALSVCASASMNGEDSYQPAYCWSYVLSAALHPTSPSPALPMRRRIVRTHAGHPLGTQGHRLYIKYTPLS